jgi:hypothetical protein
MRLHPLLIEMLGLLFLIAGLGLTAYYFLFMSWSHSFSSPAFQRKEALVQGFAALGVLGGGALIAWGVISGRRADARQSNPPKGQS